MNYPEKILFYDGDCGFCNKTVQFVLNNERNHFIYFSPLQSEFATRFFEENHAPKPDLSTFYYYTNYQLFSQSSGVLALLPDLRFPFQLARIFQIIPICQRDQLYRFIAKKRHQLAGKFCVIPTAEQKKRFITTWTD